MEILGSLGQIYMFVLLVLLFLGSGLAVWSFISKTKENGAAKPGVQGKSVQAVQSKAAINNSAANSQQQNDNKFGGLIMANNKWFKLAVFSFMGILISAAILAFTSTSSSGMSGHSSTNMQEGNTGSMQMSGMPMNNTQMNNNMPMNMQSGMNSNMQMGNIPMGGTQMNSMPMYNAQMGNMPMNSGMQGYPMSIQEQLYMMQMQLNQMQQQINNMQMQQGGMNNMQQGSSMSGSGSMQQSGGMGMMNGMM